VKALANLLFVAGLLLALTHAAYVPSGEGLSARVGAWFDAVGVVFLVGLGAMMAGALLARRLASPRNGARAAGAGVGDAVTTAQELLADLERTLAPLEAAGLAEDAARQGALKAALDTILEDRVPDFLELRTALIDALGLETFAAMIGHFASMERNTARAWSALTDEAWQEVGPSLERAREGLARARAEMPALTAG
jgi:hypothetical protein